MVSVLGDLHPAAHAAEAGLWNRVLPNDDFDAAVDVVAKETRWTERPALARGRWSDGPVTT